MLTDSQPSKLVLACTLVLAACATRPMQTTQPLPDLAEPKPVRPAEAERPAQRLPPGEIAFVSERDGNTEIYLMSADGSNARNLTRHPAADYSPAWSPDGGRFAFISDRSGKAEIYAMDVDGSQVVQLTDDPEGWWGPTLAWSPDGSRLVAERGYTFNDFWTRAELHVVSSDSGGSRPLYPDQRMAHNDFDPEWLPNGDWVDFIGGRYTTSALYSVLSEGGVPQGVFVRGAESVLGFASGGPEGEIVLVSWWLDPFGPDFTYRLRIAILQRETGDLQIVPGAEALDPMGEFYLVRSPEGSRVAFPATRIRGHREIYVLWPSDLVLAPATDIGQIEGRPSWSADGLWVAFASEADGDREIYIVPIGHTPTELAPHAVLRLTSSPGLDSEPAWKP